MGRRLAHIAGVLLITSSIALANAEPASAKVPPVSVELTTETPTAGEAFEVTVRFWDDTARTNTARWPNMRRFDKLVWFVPVGPHHASAEAMSVDMLRDGYGTGVYRASVVLTSPGRWYACTWGPPCESDAADPGSPGRLELVVLEAPERSPSPSLADPLVPSGSGRGDGTPVPVAAAAALAVVLAAALGVRQSRGRSSSRPGPR